MHLNKQNHKPRTSLFQRMVEVGSCLGKLIPLLSSLKLHKTEAITLPCTFTPPCRSTRMFKINQAEDLALFYMNSYFREKTICCSATSTTMTSSTQKGLHADCKAPRVPSNGTSGVGCYFSSQVCISSTPGAPPLCPPANPEHQTLHLSSDLHGRVKVGRALEKPDPTSVVL